ncbi:M28 family peptidase [candidate division KSB1 bacterium]
MLKRAFLLALALVFVLSLNAEAQITPWLYWTLLSEDQMAEIVGEASGETAFHTIMETGGYTRDRRSDEYRTTFFESQYIYDELNWYGVPGAEIVRIPSRDTWDGVKGELWEITPMKQKLASYQDWTWQLASGSVNSDVTAELVWVGSGSRAEIEAVDVTGKIAVGEGSVSSIHNNSVVAGAVGAVGISTSHNYFDPIRMSSGSVRDITNRETGEIIAKATFGFIIPIRDGQYLKQRLQRGERITARARVESKMEPYEMQNVICHIPGEDLNTNAVIFSAHLYEGLTKQGANDNKSGSAGILEVARVLNTLIEEGRLPKPKRTIRFLWGPEFSGTGPWVRDNQDVMDRTFCNINMDMVGEWLSLNKSYFCLMRTTFGNPHYINDVMENYYRFVGEGNRERIQNRSTAYKVPHRIVAPTGADEPFHYSIETHYGASDHEVFNNWGVQVPGVMMIAWPDQWYHTSGDIASKSDPTQMKRVAVIAAAAAYTIANADDDMAIKIAGETTSNGTRRLGHQFVVGLESINKASAGTLAGAYEDSRTLIEGHVLNEKATLATVIELATDTKKVGDYIEAMQKTIDGIGEAHLAALETHMKAAADRLNTNAISISMSDLEKKADKMVPKQTAKVTANGYNGYSQFINQVPEEERAKYPYGGGRGGRLDTTEIGRLINGTNSALDIKKLHDAQSTRKADLQALINYLEVLKLAGLIEM